MATDIEAVVYLMLLNQMVHDLFPSAITIGEDVSGMPTFCRCAPGFRGQGSILTLADLLTQELLAPVVAPALAVSAGGSSAETHAAFERRRPDTCIPTHLQAGGRGRRRLRLPAADGHRRQVDRGAPTSITAGLTAACSQSVY